MGGRRRGRSHRVRRGGFDWRGAVRGAVSAAKSSGADNMIRSQLEKRGIPTSAINAVGQQLQKLGGRLRKVHRRRGGRRRC